MTGWTAEAVLAAAAKWAWVPPDATQVLTGEYQFVRYPEHYLTFPAEVLWSRSERPVSELISEISGHARAWGRGEVYWEVSEATRPPGTEAALIGLGATLVETCQILACDLTDGLPEISVPAGVHCEVIRDEAGLRAGQRVYAEVFGRGREPSAAEFATQLAEVREGLESGTGFRVVASAAGEPASYGGCTLADGVAGRVARLWGASTRAAWRGRGAYRAVLARRLAVAREHGATLALTKGRTETSAPILRRAGFTVYSEERCYRLDLAAGQ